MTPGTKWVLPGNGASTAELIAATDYSDALKADLLRCLRPMQSGLRLTGAPLEHEDQQRIALALREIPHR